MLRVYGWENLVYIHNMPIMPTVICLNLVDEIP